MNKRLLLLSILSLLFISISFAGEEQEIKNVKNLVIKSYANGAFNKLDTVAMKNGFHPDFSIYSVDGEEISKYSISAWIAGVEKRKLASDFDPKKYAYEYKFLNIRVKGKTAHVEIEYSQKSKEVFRDFLLLLRFDSGWRIVSKVYHSYK